MGFFGVIFMRGLYIHIPFCARKCRYCDFTSYVSGDKTEYIEALAEEMKRYGGGAVDTVFIGGGTPSVLDARLIKRLCAYIDEYFDIAENCEFTAEANPGTLSKDKLRAFMEGGVNRLSVGAQSFDDGELKALGRIHDAKTAYNTICEAAEYGFENINVDLMTGLPNQNAAKLKNTLKTAVSLPVKHISAYSLIIEEGTPMADDLEKGELALPDEDSDRNMYAMTARYLRENGFLRYEISNYAREGFECGHNIKYWECEEYYGIGAAAHSYINGARFHNTASLDKYMRGDFREGETELLSERDKMAEFVIMGMRMDKGISAEKFKRRFGRGISEIYGAELKKFTEAGLILFDGKSYRFSDRGRDVSNSILCEFV